MLTGLPVLSCLTFVLNITTNFQTNYITWYDESHLFARSDNVDVFLIMHRHMNVKNVQYLSQLQINQQAYLLLNLDWYVGTEARLVTASKIVLYRKIN